MRIQKSWRGPFSLRDFASYYSSGYPSSPFLSSLTDYNFAKTNNNSNPDAREVNMAGIPAHLLKSLRAALAECDQFETNRSLRNLFADTRLTPWRNSLPETNGRSERVDSSISYLHDKKHR